MSLENDDASLEEVTFFPETSKESIRNNIFHPDTFILAFFADYFSFLADLFSKESKVERVINFATVQEKHFQRTVEAVVKMRVIDSEVVGH